MLYGIVSGFILLLAIIILVVKKSRNSGSTNKPEKVLRTINGKQGLVIEILQEGKSNQISKKGSTVSVHYKGWLDGGKVFDSSEKKGQPLSITIGAGKVIQGWEEGLLDMKVGEKRRLKIPPILGYGILGRQGIIPPNATLHFDVELVALKN